MWRWLGAASRILRRARTRGHASHPLARRGTEPHVALRVEISVAIRPGDQTMRSEIDSILERRRGEIRRILTQFRVPQLDNPEDKSTWPALGRR